MPHRLVCAANLGRCDFLAREICKWALILSGQMVLSKTYAKGSCWHKITIMGTGTEWKDGLCSAPDHNSGISKPLFPQSAHSCLAEFTGISDSVAPHWVGTGIPGGAKVAISGMSCLLHRAVWLVRVLVETS